MDEIEVAPDVELRAGKRYEAERARVVARVQSGEVSASMSGIEYYAYKTWSELKEKDPEIARLYIKTEASAIRRMGKEPT